MAEDRADVLAGTLREVIAELERLNRDTERAFLTTGGKLTAFTETVNLMSSSLRSVAELISGESGRGAERALNGVLDLSRGMGARATEDNGLLGSMREEGNRLKRTLSQLSGIVSAFHSLGLLTRIETARLGKASADFGNLAEDVRLLARNVETRVESALDAAGELTPRIESALQDVAALQEEQAKELPEVMQQVLESLASFHELERTTHAASVRLGNESGEISSAFQRLVVSMQFQDITRQQVEHVIDVLRRLSSESPARGGVIAVILELQSSQLSHAREKFSESVTIVAKSLDYISGHVVRMAEESRALGGRSGTSSFFQQMERGCSAILASFSHCAVADAATRAASEGVAEKVAGVRGSIGEIRTIEAQMRRTAMNAMISAEHLGQPGEALGALADLIRQKAYESSQGSETLIKTLDTMNAVANRLSGRGRLAVDLAAEAEGLEAMRSAVAQLRLSQESSLRQIAEIAASADRLCRELAQAQDGLSIGAEFAESVRRMQVKLKAAIDEMRCGLPGESEEAMLAGLAEFTGRYTMQEQHDIHASLTGALRRGEEIAPAAREFAVVDGGEFGDNVELF